MTVIGECLAALVFGTAVGLLAQRSRFCTATALRDAILFNSFHHIKALLAAMMVLTFGFTLFMTFGEGKPMRFDVGLNQFAGGFIFGLGMVLAGACTVSTWVKSGTGNVGAMWTLLFTLVGMLLFSLVWSVFSWPPPPGLSARADLGALQLGFANAETQQADLGVPAVVFGLVQLGVLVAVYRLILKKEATVKSTLKRG